MKQICFIYILYFEFFVMSSNPDIFRSAIYADYVKSSYVPGYKTGIAS